MLRKCSHSLRKKWGWGLRKNRKIISRKNLNILTLSFFSAVFAPRYLSAAGSSTDAFNFRTGLVSYATSGVDPKSGSSVQNMTFEWSRYLRKDSAVQIGYHLMTDSLSGRTQYQSGSLGYRVFPWTLGVPLRQRVMQDTVEYNFFWKPYLDIGISYGRYLISTLGSEAGLLEASSETLGLPVSAGILVQVMNTIALDMSVSYEQIFGHSSPLAFGATHLGFNVGFVYYL